MDSPSRYFYTRGPRTGVRDSNYTFVVERGVVVGTQVAYARDAFLYANDMTVRANGFY